jgi:hypothetical protein
VMGFIFAEGFALKVILKELFPNLGVTCNG